MEADKPIPWKKEPCVLYIVGAHPLILYTGES